MTTRGRRRLDRETQHEHVVYVEICDQGSPRLCTTVPVVVTVGDLNDNPPVFKQQIYNFNVPAEKTGELCRYVFLFFFVEGRTSFHIVVIDSFIKVCPGWVHYYL